jgi:hypothetical protein
MTVKDKARRLGDGGLFWPQQVLASVLDATMDT